jgi:hypothetical protein
MCKRESRRLKREHLLVLNALEAANVAYQRVAVVGEVVAALSSSEKDVRRLKRAYFSSLRTTVNKILEQLYNRGVIFSPGVIGSRRYYGSVNALAPETRSLPSLTTRRRRVLQIVRDSVTELGRAVRTCDVLDYAARHPDECAISPELITRDIMNLKNTGDLRLVGVALRGDSGGRNYYLPLDVDPVTLGAKQPLTWMEEVATSFRELWEERAQEAAASNRLPRPVSAFDVRARMMSVPEPHPNLQKRMYLVNALTELSETGSAIVRKIRRPGQRAVLWAPSELSDDQIDVGDLFISDMERTGAAVARSVQRLGRPVSVKDIKAEINFDRTLQPAGLASLACAVSEASRLHMQVKRKGETTRYAFKHVRVFRVGRIGNDSYYYHSSEGLNDAKFFVQVEYISRKWNACSAVEQMTALAGCAYHSIALGRALMISKDVRRAQLNLERLLKTGYGSTENRNKAEGVLDQVQGVTKQVRLWLKDKRPINMKCPTDVNPVPPTWTGAELLSFLKPLYPLATEITDPNRLIRLVFSRVRRVPNVNFRSRFSRSHDEAAEYFFDRTDAVLFAAQKWGGYECCFQAAFASSNLGHLRDARFVVPLLSMDRFEDRMAGVACLAFLQTEEAVERLKTVAVNDSSPEVRESALWACGFIEGNKVNDFLASRQEHDREDRIREFSRRAQRFSVLDWWTM